MNEEPFHLTVDTNIALQKLQGVYSRDMAQKAAELCNMEAATEQLVAEINKLRATISRLTAEVEVSSANSNGEAKAVKGDASYCNVPSNDVSFQR